MQIRQLMQKNPVVVSPTSSIYEAALKMKDHNVGSVLVVEEGWKLKGILTDRDIALALAEDSLDAKTTPVYNVMTQDPITTNIDADVDSAIRIMNRAKIKRLPVTENGRLVGILSSADIAHEIKGQMDQFFGLEEAFAKI